MDIEKEKRALQHLKTFEPKDEPYYLCYSGGNFKLSQERYIQETAQMRLIDFMG